MAEVKMFASINCGTPFAGAPPDDKHPLALQSQCPKGDSLPIPYICENCGHSNTIWWDMQHTPSEFDRVTVS